MNPPTTTTETPQARSTIADRLAKYREKLRARVQEKFAKEREEQEEPKEWGPKERALAARINREEAEFTANPPTWFKKILERVPGDDVDGKGLAEEEEEEEDERTQEEKDNALAMFLAHKAGESDSAPPEWFADRVRRLVSDDDEEEEEESDDDENEPKCYQEWYSDFDQPTLNLPYPLMACPVPPLPLVSDDDDSSSSSSSSTDGLPSPIFPVSTLEQRKAMRTRLGTVMCELAKQTPHVDLQLVSSCSDTEKVTLHPRPVLRNKALQKRMRNLEYNN